MYDVKKKKKIKCVRGLYEGLILAHLSRRQLGLFFACFKAKTCMWTQKHYSNCQSTESVLIWSKFLTFMNLLRPPRIVCTLRGLRSY